MKTDQDSALIHLSVPRETKARWVRESRAAGLRLTDWIVRAVEEAQRRRTALREMKGERNGTEA